jgi:dienelactone hydrolase
MRRAFTVVYIMLAWATATVGAAEDDAKRLARAAAVAFEYDNQKAVGAHTRQPDSRAGFSLQEITLKPEGEEHIPLLLALPLRHKEPVPLVVLLHGLGGQKRQLIDLYARRLAEKGIASVAFDLDGHGDLKTPTNDFQKKLGSRNLMAIGMGISRSVVFGRRVIDYAATRPELDTDNTAVMGYSLGSCIGCILTNADPRIRGLVMNAGGTSRQLVSALQQKSVAAAFSRMYRPMVHAPGIAPRPVLMINGRYDRVFPPADAKLLFDSLGKGKELRWYKSNHRLSSQATGDGVRWLAKLFAEEDKK